MDLISEGVKAKTMAVFENVVTMTKERKPKKKKFRPHRIYDDDSSQSEPELIIDDGVDEQPSKKKRTAVRVRLKEEVLRLKCEWDDCSETFSNLEVLVKHLKNHLDDAQELECKWADCPDPDDIISTEILAQHVVYHGYLAKLVNIGENALKRSTFPECSLERKYIVDIPKASYTCEWKGCEHIRLDNIFDLLCHVECHVLGVPTGKKADKVEVIPCLWAGCGVSVPTRYKLADHMKVHTKEKTIACPTCMSLFSGRTKFSDHRKRQLNTDMRSYQCSQCLKLFSIERLLSDHMRSHINQYKCTLCDMTSPKPSMLAKHYRYRHMDSRPFVCQTCGKTFVTKSNLTTHNLTHRDNPFKCEQCEFGCKSKVGLRSHMIRIHGLETANYECEVCKSCFSRGDYLTCHLIKIHKFHWPSGHCRFRYRKDTDGIYRLQTVRYESLGVTEEMIKSESMQSTKNPSSVAYSVSVDKDAEGGYNLTVLQNAADEGPAETKVFEEFTAEDEVLRDADGRIIVITVEDVDEFGNVVRSREFDSNQMLLSDDSGTIVQASEPPTTCKRDMPVFDMIEFENGM